MSLFRSVKMNKMLRTRALLLVTVCIIGIYTILANISEHEDLNNHYVETVRLPLYSEYKRGGNVTCPQLPAGLVGSLKVRPNMTVSELPLKRKNKALIEPGGIFRSLDCNPVVRTAIIIPYRAREEHLQILVNHLHNVLQEQKIEYRIFVVELALGPFFNRGLLSNVGYQLASELDEYTCYIFHDVDHLMMNDHNIYRCNNLPTLMVAYSSKYNFTKFSDSYFGGVQAFTKDQFLKVNGFTNMMFGWGGEDDDIYLRIRYAKMVSLTTDNDVGGYMTLGHDRDAYYPTNTNKYKIYKLSKKFYKTEGVSSLQYKLIKKELRPLYTWIYVSADDKAITKRYRNYFKWDELDG